MMMKATILSIGNIMLLFLVDYCMTCLFNCFGEVSEDVLVSVGGDIIITCKLPDEEEIYTANDLYFKFDNYILPMALFHAKSRRLLELHIYNASIADKGSYFCFLNTSSHDEGGKIIGHGAVTVDVGEPPPQISKQDVKCISNNFEDLFCDWCEFKVRDVIWKNTTWTRLDVNGLAHGICIGNTSAKCACYLKERPHQFVTYNFTLTAVNRFGKTVANISVKVDNTIVKPPPVEFDEISETQYGGFFTWHTGDPVFGRNSHIFNISWKSIEERPKIWGTKSSSQSNINITNLKPYKTYTLCVVTQVRGSAFWSDVQSLTFTTLPSAPSVGPLLTPGGYSSHSLSESQQRVVHLYFLEVPEYLKNGRITHHIVTIQNLGNLLLSYVILNQTSQSPTYALLDLSVKNDYNISIQAVNIAGASPLSHIIVYAMDSQDINKKGTLVAESRMKNTIILEWPSVFNAVLYTLFWCSVIDMEGDICQSGLNWTVVGSEQTNFTLSHAVGRYKYSIAVNSNVGSSGIVEWVCPFQHDKNPQSPIISVNSEHSAGKLTLTIEPPNPCDDFYAGRPLHYLVAYCEENKCRKDSNTSQIEQKAMSGTHKILIEGLEANTKYIFTAKARGYAGFSHTTEVEMKTGARRNMVNTVVLPIILGILFLLLLGFSIRCLCKYYRKTQSIDIVLPEQEEVHLVWDIGSDACNSVSDISVYARVAKEPAILKEYLFTKKRQSMDSSDKSMVRCTNIEQLSGRKTKCTTTLNQYYHSCPHLDSINKIDSHYNIVMKTKSLSVGNIVCLLEERINLKKGSRSSTNVQRDVQQQTDKESRAFQKEFSCTLQPVVHCVCGSPSCTCFNFSLPSFLSLGDVYQQTTFYCPTHTCLTSTEHNLCRARETPDNSSQHVSDIPAELRQITCTRKPILKIEDNSGTSKYLDVRMVTIKCLASPNPCKESQQEQSHKLLRHSFPLIGLTEDNVMNSNKHNKNSFTDSIWKLDSGNNSKHSSFSEDDYIVALTKIM